LKQTININPNDAEAYYDLGTAYGNLNRYQKEVEAYKQAININPNFAEVYCNLGVAYGELGRYQEAIEAFKQAIQIDPNDAGARRGLDMANRELRKSQQSISNSGSSRCFIATVVYGSYDAHEVLVLKQWRDSSLSNTHIGQRFIRLYYKVSPSIASWISGRSLIKILTKKLLDIFIKTLLRNYR